MAKYKSIEISLTAEERQKVNDFAKSLGLKATSFTKMALFEKLKQLEGGE